MRIGVGLGSWARPIDKLAMLFGKRKKKAAPSVPAKGEAAGETEIDTAGSDDDATEVIPADRALDFMAEMLRVLGEHAFDVGTRSAEEIEEHFEAWARHLLIGVPSPDRAPVSGGGKASRRTSNAICLVCDAPSSPTGNPNPSM